MENKEKAFLIILASVFILVIFYGIYKAPSPVQSLCPQNSPNRSSIRATVCGNYTLIAPAGLEQMGGNVIVYQQNGYWNPAGCAYSITSLVPPKGTKNLTLSVYNTSKVFVMIIDIPAYLTNSTGTHLHYLEYAVKCG